MGELSKLPNIGEKVEEQLNAVDIFTYEDLKKLGAENAWLKIQSIDPSACIHRLLALEGALQGIPKKLLPEERKAELKSFYEEHKMYI
ncbi:MAG: TfoX/Sxy family protein [Oscillospiraceae bacterium]|nr:TfoX/Sxy family protein [Oscillospiraceae bacterium]